MPDYDRLFNRSNNFCDIKIIGSVKITMNEKDYLMALKDVLKRKYSLSGEDAYVANQGHSIPVDVELEEKEPPKILYHGTGEKYIASIDQNGLIPKSRLYVHLSKDVETSKAVGKRHGKEVVYSINSEQMYKDGYKFYLSKNGVWLTKKVPVKYLMKEV